MILSQFLITYRLFLNEIRGRSKISFWYRIFTRSSPLNSLMLEEGGASSHRNIIKKNTPAPPPDIFSEWGKGGLIFLGVKTPFPHLFVYTVFIAASTRRCGTQLLRPFRFSLTPVIEPLLHCWWSARETICKTSLSANQVPNWKATFLNKIERSTRLTWFRGRYCHCCNTY